MALSSTIWSKTKQQFLVLSVLVSTLLPQVAGAASWWQPPVNATWHIQYSGKLDLKNPASIYNIDLFDTPTATINTLHAKGKRVICYLSAGSYENWRPDKNQFPSSVLGKNLDGWPGERWLDIRSAAVRSIMAARMDLAVTKGCDGVEPDNVDGYTQDSGFLLTANDQLDYNRFLADAAHARNLGIGLKNDLEQVPALVSSFDWALNESCMVYKECHLATPFILAGKPVFHIEYSGTKSKLCKATTPLGFRSILKRSALTAWEQHCW
ncbi:MAG: endo alpha-1,4 polygalactosaminidase [Patescibacteria group bacterium]